MRCLSLHAWLLLLGLAGAGPVLAETCRLQQATGDAYSAGLVKELIQICEHSGEVIPPWRSAPVATPAEYQELAVLPAMAPLLVMPERRMAVAGRHQITVGTHDLLSAITVDGEAALARPIEIQVDGVPIRWQRVSLVMFSDARSEWLARGTHGTGSALVRMQLHFDGLLTFELSWVSTAQRAPSVRFVMPLKQEFATLWSRGVSTTQPPPRRADRLLGAVAPTGGSIAALLHDDTATLPFAYHYLFGNDDRGLTLQLHSRAGWHGAPESGLSLRRIDASVEVGLNLDSGGHRASAGRVSFALQLLPFNTHRQQALQALNPAQFADAGPATRKHFAGHDGGLAQAARAGLKTVVIHQGWTEWQGYPGTGDAEALQALKDVTSAAHQLGLQVLIYLGAEVSEAAPGAAEALPRLVAVPRVKGRSRGQVAAWRPGDNAAFATWIVPALRRTLQETGVDGVFLDLLPTVPFSANPYAGHGYLDAAGRVHAEADFAGTRALLHALHDVVREHRPDGVIACHASGLPAAGQGFCDYVLTGEDEVLLKRRHPEAALAELLPLTEFRSRYSVARRGLPIVWMAKPQRGGFTMDEVGSVALLHGMALRTQWPEVVAPAATSSLLNPPAAVRRYARIWQHLPITSAPTIAWLPYWQQDLPLLHRLPDQVSVSLYREPRAGGAEHALAVVVNMGGADVHYPLAIAGQERSLVRVLDVLEDRDLPMRGGTVTLTLKPWRPVVVRLDYAASE